MEHSNLKNVLQLGVQIDSQIDSKCEISHLLERGTKHSLYGCGKLSLVDAF